MEGANITISVPQLRAFGESIALAVVEQMGVRNGNSDDFIFDNEMLAQIFYKGFEIGEVTCPTKYFEEASSINLRRSAVYGLGCIRVSLVYRLCKWHLCKSGLFK